MVATPARRRPRALTAMLVSVLLASLVAGTHDEIGRAHV